MQTAICQACSQPMNVVVIYDDGMIQYRCPVCGHVACLWPLAVYERNQKVAV